MIYEGIDGKSFVLENGRFEGEPYVPGGAARLTIELLEEMTAFGDLDGDAVPDAAVLLAVNSGGSGTRVWVAAVTKRYGEATSYGALLVGHRPQLRSLGIEKGRIRLDIVGQGPGDAACCPTHLWNREWGVVEGTLKETAKLMEGRLSLDVLGDAEWVLTHFDIGKEAHEASEITIHFEQGRLSGSGGCNGYFADVIETSPGVIDVGPATSTKMACPPGTMLFEMGFLEDLGRVSKYGFWMGELALTWQGEDGFGSMLFEPRS